MAESKIAHDPLEGKETSLLNAILAKIQPLAQQGDGEAIDRVIRILDLKRKYAEDRRATSEDWQL